ncbi:MAG TPA: aldo/keto reductase [Solirubrobacteraceae bacterium]|nr:aldo/keto reductase [Solirubrobacteraceae bacterium]
MRATKLGRNGPAVSALGLGCMGMSGMYGPSDRAESIATIRAALAAGIDLLDTGDFYGMGHNELLIGEALRGVPREQYMLSVKFGAQRGPDGAWLGYDARPAAVKTALAYSLGRLGTDHVDVYRPARLDRAVPVEETIGAIAELVGEGYVRHVGLSEVGVQTIRRAAAVHPICDLQIEYSLISRGIEPEILPACRELGIAITAYGVLSRGLIGGHMTAETPLVAGDFRSRAPRFSEANRARNLELAERLRELALAHGATAAQTAIAWVLAQGEDIVPLIGARTRERLQEALGALDVELGAEGVAALERAIPADAAAGARYPEQQMAVLDSERG